MIALFHGFSMPFIAIRFMFKHRMLLKYALIPFLINVVIFTSAGIIAWMYFSEWIQALLPLQGSAWYWMVMYYTAMLIFAVLLAIAFVMVFTLMGGLIASPFNDVLSEKTERILEQNWREEKFSLRILIGDIGRSIGNEINKMVLFAALFGGIFLLNLLPGVGTIMYFSLQIGFTFLVLAMEFVDFSMSRRRMPFKQKLSYVYRHSIPLLSFGSVLFVMGLIPVLNYMLFPTAVVAGTILFHELNSKRNIS